MSLVDWGLAQRLAGAVAGSPDPGGNPFTAAAIEAACEEALPAVVEYTGLEAQGEIPAPEAVDRTEWTRMGLRTLREVSAGIDERLAEDLSLPGPLGPMARSLAGAAAGAEAGVAIGYTARRVLGQYDVSLVTERPARLLFVVANLADAHRRLGSEPADFRLWSASHETTHAVQFAAVPWLRDHVAGLVRTLLTAVTDDLEQGSMRRAARRLLTTDPRQTLRSLLQGELPRLLAGSRQAVTLDRLQATMAVIEGYAEHVMDSARPDCEEAFGALRARMDARRASRGGLSEAIARILGLDLKLRQYRLGKDFCDAVAREGGIQAVNLVWSSPDTLPSLEELDDPHAWLIRVGGERVETAA